MNGSRWVIDASVLAKVYFKDEQFSSIADDVVSRAASCRFPDALYLLVAQRSDYPLLTADRRLLEGAQRVSIPAMWIENVAFS